MVADLWDRQVHFGPDAPSQKNMNASKRTIKTKSLPVPAEWRRAHRVLVGPIDARRLLLALYARVADTTGAMHLLSAARLIRAAALAQ